MPVLGEHRSKGVPGKIVDILFIIGLLGGAATTRTIYCLRNGEPLDQDVYDGAAWSVISPLSAQSVSERSRSVDIPDFTRGAWQTAQPLGIVG